MIEFTGFFYNLRSFLLIGLFLMISALNAQNIESCGIDMMTQRYLNEHPGQVQKIENTRLAMEQYISDNQNSQLKAGVVYTIPVVVHVLHECGNENISDDQIKDGISTINKDFRKLNADIGQVVSSFQGIASDAEIQFKLAQKDPNGNCTNGIDRIITDLTNQAHDNSKLNQWDPSRYLNIWVVKTINNNGGGGIVAGYAYFPFLAANSPGIDGVMIANDYMGTIGTAQGEDGRTLTHEVGHYLNIFHPWGNMNSIGASANCSDPNGDYVNDTPKTIGNNSTCNTSSVTCGTLDNVQNYMDYSTCTRMFTAGQVSRMRLALTDATASRNNLWSTTNLASTGTDGVDNFCKVDFDVDHKNVCSGGTVQFTDKSYHGQNTWNWTFNIGTALSTSTQNPSVTINNTGYMNVELTAGNGSNTITETKSNYLRVHKGVGQYIPSTEGFEGASIPNIEWEIENYPDDSKKWEQFFGAFSSGSSCIYLNNNGAPAGSKDDFISSTYDLSVLSAANITFDYAYAQKTSSNQDRLTVYISTNCGQTWTSRSVLLDATLTTASPTTSNYIPGSGDWKSKTVTLFTPDFKEGFAMKFAFLSDGGNNVFIDNIKIDGTFKDEPVLHLPKDAELNVANNVTIDWKAVKDVDEYEYQIDTSPGFSANLITGKTTYINGDPAGTDTEFETNSLTNGQKYWWRVRTIKGGVTSGWSDSWEFTVSANGVGIQEIEQDFSASLSPNPTKDKTILSLNIRRNENVSIDIFDIQGAKVETLLPKELLAGTHKILLEKGTLKSGVYFLIITYNNKIEKLKLLIQ